MNFEEWLLRVLQNFRILLNLVYFATRSLLYSVTAIFRAQVRRRPSTIRTNSATWRCRLVPSRQKPDCRISKWSAFRSVRDSWQPNNSKCHCYSTCMYSNNVLKFLVDVHQIVNIINILNLPLLRSELRSHAWSNFTGLMPGTPHVMSELFLELLTTFSGFTVALNLLEKNGLWPWTWVVPGAQLRFWR